MISTRLVRLALAGLALIASAHAFAADVVRHKLPNSDFPIALAVEVPAGKKIVFVSGMGPDISDKTVPANTFPAYGDTKTQTISTFEKINAALKSMKLQMKDVVKMQVFLVGDPAKDGNIDFAGFMEGYTMYFGNAAKQTNLPARSAVKVAGLAAPGWLVEIEVTCVSPN